MSSKIKKIAYSLENEDWRSMSVLSVSEGGFLNKEVRRSAWSFLLKAKAFEGKLPEDRWNVDSEVIRRDIERSMYHFDIHQLLSQEVRELKREDLSAIVNGVSAFNPSLHYYQGFHSICTVFFEIGGRDLGFAMSLACAERFLLDNMRVSFEDGTMIEMMLIYELVKAQDREFGEKLQDIYTFGDELSIPIFSLSWVLTWLAHNIESFADTCRIFDFVLGTHPLSPIYLAAEIILSQKKTVEEFDSMPEVQQFFSEFASNLNAEEVCQGAYRLMKEIPPKQLIDAQKFLKE